MCAKIKTVLCLLTFTVSPAWSLCPGEQLSCLSQDAFPRILCIDRGTLCSAGAISNPCQAGVLGNITLQCSTNPPKFVCANGEIFPLEGLCNGMTQCSDGSDETNLLCEDATTEEAKTTEHCCRPQSTVTSIDSTKDGFYALVVQTKSQILLSSVASPNIHSQSHIQSKGNCTAPLTVNLVTTATPVSPSVHQPTHNFEKWYVLAIGGATGGIVLTLIILSSLIVVVCKMSRIKDAKVKYSSNSTIKHVEHGEGDCNTDAEMGLRPQQTGYCGASLSPRVLNSCLKGRLEVPFSALDLQDKLGMGTFGTVYKAELRNLSYPHRQPKPCVVKILKDSATKTERAALLSQCLLLQYLEPHPHLVKMLGCCITDHIIALVLEICNLGNLRDFLIRNKGKYQQVSSRRESGATMGMPSNFSSRTPGNYALDIEEMCLVEQAAKRVNELGSFWECKRGIDKEEDENDEDFDLSLHTLLSFGRQISLGMEFLAQRRIVHRELAARKVLVCQDWKLKISDFGIPKDISEELYYEERREKRLARWTAPEALIDRQFTTMSDMWSFGVVLWEIVTLGSLPYPEFHNSEVLEMLRNGYRMPKPPNCPQYLYELMRSCWSEQPSSRPSFKSARRQLDQVIMTIVEAEEYLLMACDQLN